MAITANTLPSVPPDFPLPLDENLLFAQAQTLTATGYINNVTAQLTINPGRLTGFLAVDITAIDVSSGNEAYSIYLFGSNDVNWGNGNVENLGGFDMAAASAGRVVPTILGISPTIPPVGRGGWVRAFPFTNYTGGGFVFQYLRCYLVAGGTTPSITLSAWIVPAEMKY